MTTEHPDRIDEFGLGRFDRADDWARRRRLEQQLHDGPALRLAAVALRLGVCGNLVPAEHHELRTCLDGVQDELHSVLQELREVSNQIYPPMLGAAGLGAALEALAERLGLPVTVHAPDERFGAAVEAAAYFATTEQLRRLAPIHDAASVAVRRVDRNLELTIAATGTPVGEAETQDEVITVRIPCE